MKKFGFLLLFAFILVVFPNLVNAQSHDSIIRFGLIADIQYADANTRGTRFYRNSLKKLDSSIQDLNRRQVEFTLNLGDITDRNPKDLDPVLDILKKASKKIYNLLGNHDYQGIQDNRALIRKLAMPSEYYSFKKGNWRFVMLNTNEVASYANIAGTWKQQELEEMMKRIKQTGGVNDEEYNGGVSSRQLTWLKKLLRRSERKGEKVLIFSHHPFGCADGLTALNDKEVVSLVSKFKCVKSLVAGHHHEGAFCEIGSLPCIIAEGMVETAEGNSYGVVELYANKLVLTGYGRMTSRTIHF